MGRRSRGKPARARQANCRTARPSADEARARPGQPPANAVAFVRQSPPARAVGVVLAAGKPAGTRSTTSPPAQTLAGAPPTTAGRGAQIAAASGAGCLAVVAEAQPQGIAATYWIEPCARVPVETDAVTIRFVGERVDLEGRREPGDRFTHDERVDGLSAGHGRVAVTARVQGISAGSWRVTATPLVRAGDAQLPSAAGMPAASLPPQVSTVATRLAAFNHGPAVRLAVWPVLVGVAVIVAVTLQGLLHAHAHHAVLAAVLASLAASVIGYASAKLYYLLVHREPLRTFVTAGTCIQGFLIGAIGSLTLAAALFGLPVGNVLDVAAPAVFLGMAVGRPGCFFSGCCAGRPTGSRWGLFSSDRRLAVRRIPVQLLEAAVALLIGVAALLAVLTVHRATHGLIFLGAAAAYTLARQLLFPLRADAHTPRGRRLATAASAAVLLAELLVVATR